MLLCKDFWRYQCLFNLTRGRNSTDTFMNFNQLVSLVSADKQLTNMNQALCEERNNSRKHTIYSYQRAQRSSYILRKTMSYQNPLWFAQNGQQRDLNQRGTAESRVVYLGAPRDSDWLDFYQCMILASWVTVRSRLAGSSEGSCLFIEQTKNGTPFWAASNLPWKPQATRSSHWALSWFPRWL